MVLGEFFWVNRPKKLGESTKEFVWIVLGEMVFGWIVLHPLILSICNFPIQFFPGQCSILVHLTWYFDSPIDQKPSPITASAMTCLDSNNASYIQERTALLLLWFLSWPLVSSSPIPVRLVDFTPTFLHHLHLFACISRWLVLLCHRTLLSWTGRPVLKSQTCVETFLTHRGVNYWARHIFL